MFSPGLMVGEVAAGGGDEAVAACGGEGDDLGAESGVAEVAGGRQGERGGVEGALELEGGAMLSCVVDRVLDPDRGGLGEDRAGVEGPIADELRVIGVEGAEVVS